MNNTPDASIAWTDPTITRLAERYYQRLAEVLGQRFPQIRSPVAPQSPSLEDFYSAVDALLRQNETPALGIEQGYGIRISDYGVIGLAIASAASLGEALQVQGDYLALITDTKRFRYRLIEEGRVMSLVIEETQPGLWPHHFVVEFEMGAQIRFFHDLEPDLKKIECTLNLPYRCPTTRKHYRDLLGCNVRFNQKEAVLTYPASWMRLPLKTSDSLLAPLLAQRCETILARMDRADDWVQRVRNQLLNSGISMQSLIDAADNLDVPVHTLRRHLYQAGTSYKEVVLDVRMQLARQYLEETHLTLQQIAYQLGYGQPSNFQLAFRKHFDLPPGQWRATRR